MGDVEAACPPYCLTTHTRKELRPRTLTVSTNAGLRSSPGCGGRTGASSTPDVCLSVNGKKPIRSLHPGISQFPRRHREKPYKPLGELHRQLPAVPRFGWVGEPTRARTFWIIQSHKFSPMTGHGRVLPEWHRAATAASVQQAARCYCAGNLAQVDPMEPLAFRVVEWPVQFALQPL